MISTRNLLFLIVTMLSFSVLAVPALAQEPNYDRINDIAENLNCPTCTGINLSDCRTLTCEQWRAKIDDLVLEGYTDQEVLDYFSTRYGDQVLQEPPKTGFTLTLWVLPVLALVVGGGWLIYTMRGWAGQNPGTSAAAAPAAPVATASPDTGSLPADNYLDQVDRDLGLEE